MGQVSPKSAVIAYFVEDTVHPCVLVKGPQDETDIYADAFVVAFGVPGGTGEGFLVAVKGEADEAAFGIKDGAAGITAGDVIVSKEIDIHRRRTWTNVAGAYAGYIIRREPPAPVRNLKQGPLPVFQIEFIGGRIVFFQYAGSRGTPRADYAVGRLQRADNAVGDAHGGIGVRILHLSVVAPHLP